MCTPLLGNPSPQYGISTNTLSSLCLSHVVTVAAELVCQENFFFKPHVLSFNKYSTPRKSRAGLLQTVKGRAVIIPSTQLGYLPGGEDKNEGSPHSTSLKAMEKK